MSEHAVRKCIVRLSAAERETLEAFIRTGKRPAAQVLKADISAAGEGWSDRRVVAALDTSLSTVSRTRQLLIEEGFDAVLRRKQSPNSASRRIFDGASEHAPAQAGAKLIALACSEPPKGRAKWTLRLLEDKVVALNIAERASDNTIGRTLKKTFSNRT